MYADLIFGNTASLKAAQCGQVIEAYSVIVTEASLGPSAMSGSDTGLATSAAPCAIASAIRRSGEKPASRLSPVSDRAAVKARRVMINGLLRDWRVHARPKKSCLIASLKLQLWQWQAAVPGVGARLKRIKR